MVKLPRLVEIVEVVIIDGQNEMLSRIFTSWNQMAAWLRGVAALQHAA